MSDYRKDFRTGAIIRINPRKFRRGRAWKAGKLVGTERWKIHPERKELR